MEGTDGGDRNTIPWVPGRRTGTNAQTASRAFALYDMPDKDRPEACADIQGNGCQDPDGMEQSPASRGNLRRSVTLAIKNKISTLSGC